MRPLIVIEGSPAALGVALGEIRRAGDELTESFAGGIGVVCCGEVSDRESAEQALLAAVRGAGLVVRVTASHEVTDRLLDDLRRLGRVEHRLGESQGATLTGDQRALLGLLSDGLTLGAAAARLGLSRRTADRRLAGARRSLGVETTAEALVSYTSSG